MCNHSWLFILQKLFRSIKFQFISKRMRQSNSFIYNDIAAIIEDRCRLAKIEDLHKTNTKLLVEWNQTADLFNKCSLESKDLKTKIMELESEREETHTKLDNLEKRMLISEEKAQTLHSEKEKLKRDLGANRNTINQLRESNENLRSLRTSHQIQMREKEKHLMKCKTLLETSESTVSELRSSLENELSKREPELQNRLTIQQKQHDIEIKRKDELFQKIQKEFNNII